MLMGVTGVGGVGRTISWITVGSLNAHMIQKYASNNVSEFYSKIAIVNTLGQSTGLLLGLIYIHYLGASGIYLIILPFTGIIRYYLYKIAFSS